MRKEGEGGGVKVSRVEREKCMGAEGGWGGGE